WRVCALRDLPAFPTRRSSDLDLPDDGGETVAEGRAATPVADGEGEQRCRVDRGAGVGDGGEVPGEAPQHALDRPEVVDPAVVARSEEHTSELQSRENLVCRLL